jgi:hypothetical protein
MGYSGSMGALRSMQAIGGAVAGLALCGIAAAPEAVADDTASAPAGEPPRVEAWSGVVAFQRFRSGYAGATWAPFGGIREDGFRLRGVVGYGSYDGDYGTGAVAFGDLLIGYHKQLGPLTIKVLGGITIGEDQPPPSPGKAPPPVTDLGGKGVLEAWWNMTDQAWTSLDASLGTTDWDIGSRIRVGWRFWPELSVGIEGGSGGTLAPTFEFDASRVGAFVRYEWATGEISISGGVAFYETKPEWEGAPGPFGTVSVLTRF